MLSSKAIIRASSALRKMPQLRASALRTASRQFSSVRISHRPQFTLPVQGTLTTLRFNSTTTTLPTPSPVDATEQAGTIPEHSLPDYIPTESLTPNLINPEHIGYLKSLGLDFGWGPSTLIQFLLESIHVFSGTPWWASIMLTIAVLRIAQFPFYMRMSDTAARMKELNPQVVPLTKKMRDTHFRGDKAGAMEIKKQVTELYRSAGVNRYWIGFPITQLPIFYGFYKNLNGMAELKIPGLVDGGNFWFRDLTMSDPYYILPLVSSISMGLQIFLGGEAGSTLQNQQIKRGMILIFPLMSFLVFRSWPAAITLYFVTNSMFSLVQATSLRNDRMREKLGLYPLDPAAAKNPFSSTDTTNSGLDALNIATRSGPVGKIVDIGAPKQIGAKGGFLDRITGGTLRKDGTKKTLTDYLLGEKEDSGEGALKQFLDMRVEAGKRTKHERMLYRRLKKEAAEDAARRKRVMMGKP